MLNLKPNIVAFAVVLHSAASLNRAETSLSFVQLQGRITSCHTSKLTASATRLYSTSDTATDDSSTFSSLYGNTLVSVQDCIEAHRQQQQTTVKQASKVAFVDASWYHRPDPITNIMRDPIQEFQTGPRIPKAHYVDIDALATTYELFPDENPLNLPHMMPPPSLFGKAMDAYGIGNDDHVVIYAKRGAVFTPRAWFLFLSMGHDVNKLHLMQGSLEDWIEDGGMVETHSLFEVDLHRNFGVGHGDFFQDGILNVAKLHHERRDDKTNLGYQVDCFRAAHICEKNEVLQAVNGHIANQQEQSNNLANAAWANTIIVDTRGSGYKKKGHMPSAIHLPYRSLLNPSNPLQLLPKSELHKILTEKGIDYQDSNLKIILSCGSGVSVCHGFLALKLLGRDINEENTRVYDGSWKEWGRLDLDLPRILPGDMNDTQ